MKILVYRWDIYPYDDIIHTLKKQGHFVDVLAFPISNHISDSEFEPVFRSRLAEADYDCVFSVNYYAVIAVICAKHQIPYAAWTCDSPLLSLRHPSIFSKTSYIFCFDKKEYQDLISQGVPHAFYLPLAGMKNHAADNDALTFPVRQHPVYDYDISFVGNLYDKNRYDEMCCYLPSRLCGYMDAAIEAQKNISGGNLLPQMLNDEILSDLMQYTRVANGNSSPEELRIHFATAVLSYKAAADVRTDSLNALAGKYSVDLFTTSSCERLMQVRVHPAVSYHTEMPAVFAHSKINLNFTIPNIENGIPLRVFDVLSAGGFLLTDYREEICKQFTDSTDLVVFDGMADLLKKAEYYLTQEEKRQEIAENGQKKVQQLHSYENRMEKILHTIFNS
jgi:spore maturation protein CgeB